MTRYLVDLQPIGRRIEVPAGTNLLEAAQKAGVDLVAACGGVGICGTCRVRLARGRLTPITLTEQEMLSPAEQADGLRLACQAAPLSDLTLDIPPESLPAAQQMQVDGRELAPAALDPCVEPLELELTPPDLRDLRSDLDRVQAALAERGLPPLRGDLPALARLSPLLREHRWRIRLALRLEDGSVWLAGALPPGAPLLGLAADMGSTKLAVYLVDLASGVTLARSGVMNPQIACGEDVVSRIAFANRSEENRALLQTRLAEALNQAAADLCAQAGAQMEQIVDAVVAGNTAMHHFFTLLPVAQLGAAPYVPAVSQALDVPAAALGLRLAPGARVHLPANIAGYIGGDHTACLLTAQSIPPGRAWMLIDIGTNTEISLSRPDGAVFSCSCASGPAFEGAHIRDGMRAAAGAVERVRIHAGTAEVQTIGGLPAVGICGSGILEAVAGLVEDGVVDARGVLRREAEGVRIANGRAEFLLVPAARSGHGRDVVVTRKDVNEIQLAKGAIRAGIEILLRRAGLEAAAVDDWIIAGAFGAYLDLGAAQRIGLLPLLPLARFHQVGNAAGVGAKQMLLSRAARALAAEAARRVNYVELTIQPDFTEVYVKALELAEA